MDKTKRKSGFADKTKRRQTIDFAKEMHKQVTTHGKKRGCRCFGESVRDIIRLWFDFKDEKDESKDNPYFRCNRAARPAGQGPAAAKYSRHRRTGRKNIR